MKSLSELNQCTDQSFEDFVKESICRSQRFASMLRCARPFGSADALHAAAKTIWLEQCGPVEWLDALAAHPRLGDRRTSGTAEGGEQRAVLDSMDDARAVRLAELNERYEQRFGYTFLLCAPGVPAHVVEERILSRYAYVMVRVTSSRYRLCCHCRTRVLGCTGDGKETHECSNAIHVCDRAVLYDDDAG